MLESMDDRASLAPEAYLELKVSLEPREIKVPKEIAVFKAFQARVVHKESVVCPASRDLLV